MYPYTPTEIAGALRGAKNANAALKHFLKQEIRGKDPAERYVKELRTALGAKSPEPLDRLVTAGFEKYHRHLLVMLRYAYSEPVAAIAERVITKYADDFNKTYTRADDGVSITDEAGFHRILGEVLQVFETSMPEFNLGPAGLMRSVLITAIFEPDVVAAAGETLLKSAA